MSSEYYHSTVSRNKTIYDSMGMDEPITFGDHLDFVESAYLNENTNTPETFTSTHEQIVQLPRTDRRKLYKVEEYVPLEEVFDWQQTCSQDKRITDVSIKFEKDTRLASEINKRVAVCNKPLSSIECDVVLAHGKYDNVERTGLKGGPLFNSPKNMKRLDNFVTQEGYRLPANYVFYSEDGVVDGGRITEFLNQCVQLGYKSLTVEWPSSERAGQDQDQQSLYSTAVMAAVKTWLEDNYKSVNKIIFCARQDASYDNLMDLMLTHFPVYEPDTPLEVGFKRVFEEIRDSTKKICDAIAGRSAEQTEQLGSNRKTKRRDESDETSPIKKIKEDN